MSVYLAHGMNLVEVKKYNFIDGDDTFSIAEYFYEEGKNTMLPFSHEHDEYEFIIPLTTIPLLYYNKANYIGEVGFCYPVNPYVSHGLEFDLDQSHVISITIAKNYVETKKNELGFSGKYFYTRFIYSKELIIMIRKYQEIKRRQYPNQEILDTIKKGITEYLIKEGLASGEDNRRPEKVYAKNIKKIIAYMSENYRDPNLDVATIAKMSGYSMAYFSRAFKAFMADPPVVHLNKLRLSEAKALFRNPDLTLKEIATMSGYKNLSTFTEAFKKIIKMTPKEYRKKYL